MTGLAYVGFAIAYINGPLWLRPPFRPFICGFCMSFWLSILGWATDPCRARIEDIGIALLGAAVIQALWPELMFDDRNKSNVHEKVDT